MVIFGTMLTRRRYPTANVARQAMLTYCVGVAHPGHLLTRYHIKICRLPDLNVQPSTRVS